MKTPLAALCVCIVALFALSNTTGAAQNDETLVVHEWGTFTSLQDESGAAVGGINTDDEPVPKFVHRLSDWLLLRPTEIPPVFFKGAPRCHPDVTMRLETPVVYFHPPPSTPFLSNISVQVKFNGGWLSEFYPAADATAPCLRSNVFQFGPLHSDTVSSLTWNNLDIGGAWEGPATSAHVWLSPRAVAAASVHTRNNEAERFLFYRGVAHLNAPLRISTESGELTFRSQLEGELKTKGALPIRSLWLVDIRADGKIAFRTLPPVTLDADADKILTKTPATFESSEYVAGNFGALKKRLHAALVGEGLFSDEAQALLNTWELSYFKSPGLRVFFLVPREWTDCYLPLNPSTPAKIERAMVGRIELVTTTQRELLAQLSYYPTNEIKSEAMELRKNVYQPASLKSWEKLNSGATSLEEAGVEVPKSYQLYLRLGRFRNALLLDEEARHPSESLEAFVTSYAFAGWQPPQLSVSFTGK